MVILLIVLLMILCESMAAGSVTQDREMNSREWLIGCGITPTKEMCNALDTALYVQRGWCGDDVIAAFKKEGMVPEVELIMTACLNATGRTEK